MYIFAKITVANIHNANACFDDIIDIMTKKQDRKSNNKRPYRLITPLTIAQFEAEKVITGNGTAAIRKLNSGYEAPHRRANHIVAKSKTVNASEMIENRLQQIASDAIERVSELVNSEDEKIATKNSHYVIDHIRGKAVQRSITATAKFNIQNILD